MMPEIVQALANIRLVMLTSYKNMTNVLSNGSEEWSLDQKMVLDNFETRMNKILTTGLSNIQATTKNLEEIQKKFVCGGLRDGLGLLKWAEDHIARTSFC